MTGFSVCLCLVAVVSLLPSRASAFWPFSDRADAAGNEVPLLHDPSIPLLNAATNPDPNPNKGIGALAVSGGEALVADSGPGGTIADVGGTTQSDQISLYVVRPGDTLSDISKMFGVSINTIVWANNLGSTKAIHVGQQLVILPVSGVEHKVVKGDTIASVAKKYHADTNEVAEFNGLLASDALTVGSVLIIPGGEVAVPVPAKAPTSRKIGKNPYRGGSGAAIDGFFGSPVPGAILTQGIHGWNGVDLGAAKGTPIYAGASGVVIVSRSNGGWNGGYGNYVVIDHGEGVQSLYAHMTHAIVQSGQSVSRGQLIGYVGATGEATGPHLHFEVRGALNPFATCHVGSACSPQ